MRIVGKLLDSGKLLVGKLLGSGKLLVGKLLDSGKLLVGQRKVPISIVVPTSET